MDGGSARDSRLIRSASVVERATVRSVCSKWKATQNQKRILDSIFMSGVKYPSVEEINRITAELQSHGPVESKNVAYWFQNSNAKEKRKNGRPETESRLARSSSVVESSNHASVRSKWKPTENQKRIMGSSFMSGTSNPSLDQLNSITGDLQPHGPVEGKNTANKARRPEYSSASKWASVFKPRKWNSLFRAKGSSSKSSVQGEECIGMQEEEVDSGARRNSSVYPSDLRTRELFPLNSDKSSGQGGEFIDMQKEVRSGGRRNSSAVQYEIRTLDLFPLHPGH